MYLRILLIASFVIALIVFALAAGTSSPPGEAPNISNWILAVGVGIWGIFQGLTVAWFRQKIDTLQTKDGCESNRSRCHFDDLRPLISGDSDRRLKIDGIERELKHLVSGIGDLKDTMAKQGDQIAHQAELMIKLGARFGVDLNGKD